MKIFSKDQQIIALILGLTIFSIGLFRPFHPFRSMLRPSYDELRIESRHQWFIEVAGAVRNPGIYAFDEPPTVSRAIQSTGGPVDEHRVSFDSPDSTLDTGMRIELQESGTGNAKATISPMSSAKRVVLGIPVKLNEAGVEDLAIIPKIGPALARKIVAYRQSHGSFKKWDDLRRVKGIGPTNIKSFRRYLYLK